MRVLPVSLLLVSALSAQNPCREIEKEVERLQKMRSTIQRRLQENREILRKIEEEKRELEEFKKEIEREQKEIQKERYKKLAKDFESMEPEMAGEKFSNMDNPKIAAYILYNMNSRKAGDALNYVDPKMVNKIVKILTELKRYEKRSGR
ncbi:MAG: hypothetical protein GXO19_04000 [Epsilonproteobacteria bacterium]|nr:hypothetical protein [Campylobacterota bacterium]NPA56884.1 hypothetical protein [Campylobacterota bacterium]